MYLEKPLYDLKFEKERVEYKLAITTTTKKISF